MQDPNQFGNKPLGHGQNRDGIHMIRVDIATNVAHTSVVPNFIQSHEHARNLNAD
jgi:hypothetical protein